MAKGALVEADATALFKLARTMEQMDKPMQKAIKRVLTDETKKVVAAVRSEVLAIPVKGGEGAKPYKVQKYRRGKLRHSDGTAQTFSSHKLLFQEKIGVRQAIAKGVRSSIRYGSATRGASIAVIGSSSYLPEDKKVMNRVLNREKWRHPVFLSKSEFYKTQTSNRRFVRRGMKHEVTHKDGLWVEQKGHPFFGRVTSKFRQPVHEALVKAIELAYADELGHS